MPGVAFSWRANTRRLLLFLATILAIAMLASGATAQIDSRDVVVSDAADTSLNLRSGPGLNYPVIARMPNGSWATILQTSGNWARVRHESGRVGWAWYHYLLRYVGGDFPVVASGPQGVISLRSGPGTEHRLLRNIENGSRMLVGEQRGNWFFLYRLDGSPLGWGPRAHLAAR